MTTEIWIIGCYESASSKIAVGLSLDEQPYSVEQDEDYFAIFRPCDPSPLHSLPQKNKRSEVTLHVKSIIYGLCIETLSKYRVETWYRDVKVLKKMISTWRLREWAAEKA